MVGNNTTFMAINGGTNPASVVWQSAQPIAVEAGVDYRFQVDIANLVSPQTTSAAKLKFRIGSGNNFVTIWDGTSSNPLSGRLVGDVYTVSVDANFSAGGAFYIQLFNEQTVLAGNDFAIDNLSFERLGTTSATAINTSSLDPGPTFTFNPADAATGVAVNSNITITASEAIRLVAGNATLDDSNVDALITLKDTNAIGSNIAFNATVSGNVITINPTADFSSLQQVYVAINGTAVEDTADNAGAVTSATFTVADAAAPTFDIAPAVGSVTSTGFTPSASIDEAGVIYYVVVADGATAPSAAEVKAGQASGGGAALAAASATVSSSPFTSNFAAITSLSASTAYDVYFVAEDDEGTPNIQSSVTKVDATTSAALDTTAPTLSSSTPADGAAGVAVNSDIVLTFSEAVDTETGNIIIKKVSDNSTVETFDVATSTAISGSGTTTITINPTSDLASSTDYYIEIDATAFDDAAGNSYAGISGATTLNFTTAAPANTAPVANAGPDQTVASSASVTLDGSGSSDADGNTLTYAWTQPSGPSVTLSSATVAQPTFTAPTLAVGDADAVLVFSLTVNDGTVSSSADTVTITVEAPSPTPATAFAEYEEEIRATLVDNSRRNLTSAMSANQRLIRDARGRMIEAQQALSGCNVDETENDAGVESELDSFECTPSSVSTRNYVSFDVDGTFALNGTTLSTRGSFFGQTGNFEGTQRRLFFGDFDVQHDSDTGSSTATLTARVAWEQMASDRTMLGYFIGGELASSNIAGAFEGGQDRIGVTAGGYAVHQLADQIYFDGFLSYGVGRNNLDMNNDVLALTSDYTTRTATAGAAMSGVYEYEQYEFRPELAFNYGHTWIGSVGFTGRAYALVDDTLSLDAGNVSIANLTLRPEVVWALDADTVADSRSQLSFAPRAICERTMSTRRVEDCGGGVELGLSSTSEDGLSNAEIRFVRDRVGNSYRSSFAVNLEHRF